MKPVDCWDRGFEFLRGHGYSFLVFVMSCADKRSLRRADHSFRGVLPAVFVCVDLETSTVRRPRPEMGCGATERKSGRKKTDFRSILY